MSESGSSEDDDNDEDDNIKTAERLKKKIEDYEINKRNNPQEFIFVVVKKDVKKDVPKVKIPIVTTEDVKDVKEEKTHTLDKSKSKKMSEEDSDYSTFENKEVKPLEPIKPIPITPITPINGAKHLNKVKPII